MGQVLFKNKKPPYNMNYNKEDMRDSYNVGYKQCERDVLKVSSEVVMLVVILLIVIAIA